MKSALISLHAASSHPTTTSTPAASSVLIPPPLTRGSGSTNPTTTRMTPASTSARLQGGVRPKWSQGSKETYAVAPRARWPAARNANTSACGSPAFGWNPSPTTAPEMGSTMTHPTTGLGKVRPVAVAASSRAWRMCALSTSVKSEEASATPPPIACVEVLSRPTHCPSGCLAPRAPFPRPFAPDLESELAISRARDLTRPPTETRRAPPQGVDWRGTGAETLHSWYAAHV
eukprot:CAMPEP_0181350952 /NCGR_PEP_ID=MMETSP1106-20121128/1533_1 /TAXON_ID=81844 /ORGANISM="Mantoniella antarctica, Strain SL-175" /LENGTH=230 /DNA_ID=CAMNT_0023463445 /DNA_START=179 /DNA_END=868 /DNA_ORIENTATION=-